MMTHVKYILTLLILTFLTGCYIQTKTRKPKSDLKTKTQTVYTIDNRIQVDTLIIIKIDTTLNLFKAESLVGITVKGKFRKTADSTTISYFDNLTFIESVNHQNKYIHIDIVPNMKTFPIAQKKAEKIKNKLKYNYLSDGTVEFEFYTEKKIFTTWLGRYKIDFTCGQQSKTIYLFRSK